MTPACNMVMVDDSAHNSLRQIELLEFNQHSELKQIIYFFTIKNNVHNNFFGILTVKFSSNCQKNSLFPYSLFSDLARYA